MHRAISAAAAAGLVLALATPPAAQVLGQPYGATNPSAAAYGQQPAPPAGAYLPSYGAPAATGAYGAPQPAYGQPAATYGAPVAGAYSTPPATAYGVDTAYIAPPKCSNTGTIIGGLAGAVGGGVIGNNVAGHGDKTAGTVIGGLAGGGLGALVGHSIDKHQCDQRGAYWSFKDTVPYQVDASTAADPRTNDYINRGCRMAPAQVNDQEQRYVRVCPDSNGRFRIAS